MKNEKSKCIYVPLKDGEKVWTKHRRHLYQIIANEYNIPHWKVSLVYGVAQLFIGISSFLIAKIGLIAVVSIIALYFSIFFVYQPLFEGT